MTTKILTVALFSVAIAVAPNFAWAHYTGRPHQHGHRHLHCHYHHGHKACHSHAHGPHHHR